MSKVTKRYVVYTGGATLPPVFSTRFEWLALTYSQWFLGDNDFCRVVDTRTGEIILEWRRAVSIRKH